MQIRFLVVVAANALVVAAFCIILGFVFVLGPSLEPLLCPVIKFGYANAQGHAVPAVSDITRNDDSACFTLHIHKLRSATVLKYEFAIETDLSSYIQVSPYLVDGRNKPLARSDLISHPAGERWDRRYCFDMPATVAEFQDIRVSGQAVHQRHPFWNTVTPIPRFVIPALHPPT